MKKNLQAYQFGEEFSHIRDAYENKYRSQIQRIRNSFSANQAQQSQPLLDECLEYHARVYVINGLFEALNWPILCEDDMPSLIPEMPISSLEEGRKRYIDYLGINPSTNKPLLIVEAKRPSLGLPTIVHIEPEIDPTNNIARSIVEGLKGKSLGREWDEILKQVKDYVNLTISESQYAPLRAVITNGDWLLLFLNPLQTFHNENINGDEILIYINRDHIIERAIEIWGYLEYNQVVGNIGKRIINVGELPFFVDSRQIRKMIFGLRMKYTELPTHDTARPEVIVLPVILLSSQKDCWIIIQRRFQGFDIPHKYELIKSHIGQVKDFGSNLLKETLTALGDPIDISTITSHYEQNELDFKELPGVQQIEVNSTTKTQEFLIITGTDFHFIHDTPSYPNCVFHSWKEAKDAAVAIDYPIMTPSVFKPRSFFSDAQDHHCAHSSVLAAKSGTVNKDNKALCGLRSGSDGSPFCEIIQFEEYLCCKTCIFDGICERVALFKIPCRE
jgi:hypothetical protein